MISRLLSALALSITLTLFSPAIAGTQLSVNVSNEDFGIRVGNYDYLPYVAAPPPQVRFEVVLQEYGSWVSVAQFGRVWRPYVDLSWRPYVHGHWVVTSYGPTWVGYEPWAWIGYHYGHWVLTPQFGWVWIPGYEWSPGRVVWSTGPEMIGWMPAPPPGFSYATSFGPRYDSVRFGLWVFVDGDRFGHDNYAGHYYKTDRVRDIFSRQAVQIRNSSLKKEEIERISHTQIKVLPVKTREISADQRKIRMVVIEGEQDRLRKHGKDVIQDVITPGFSRNKREFAAKQKTDVKPKADTHRSEKADQKLEKKPNAGHQDQNKGNTTKADKGKTKKEDKNKSKNDKSSDPSRR